LTDLRGAAGCFSGISGVEDAVNLKCRVNPVPTGLVHPANLNFSEILIPILDRLQSTASRGAAGRFPGISGVGDAVNRKFGVISVQTGLVHPADSIFLVIVTQISDRL